MSPAHQEMLNQVVDIQDQMLRGCEVIFKELSKSECSVTAASAGVAYEALKNTRDTLEAMVDSFGATRH